MPPPRTKGETDRHFLLALHGPKQHQNRHIGADDGQDKGDSDGDPQKRGANATDPALVSRLELNTAPIRRNGRRGCASGGLAQTMLSRANWDALTEPYHVHTQ